MAQSESSIGSSAGAAPPPASSPAAAPPADAPQPAAPPATPVAPGVATPAAPSKDAVAPPATPGAPPSEKPTTLDAAKALYRQQKERIEAEGSQPATPPVTPVEAQPAPEPAPVEAPPAEPVVEEPPAEVPPVVEAAPAAPEATSDDKDYLESTWTADEVETRFSRKLSKAERADVAARETHRADLLKTVDAIGSDLGVKVASVINPIILGDCPFDEARQPAEAQAWWDDQVDTLFDQLTLPENAHAVELVDKMGKRVVNLQLQDEICGSCHSDGRKANPQCADHIAAGREFGSNMISEEYGKNDDGTAFDFWGMKPVDFVEMLVNAAKFRDADGNALINKEFIEGELAGNKKPEPTARELELQRQLDETRTATQTEREATAAEAKRKSEEAQAVYKTQATGYVSRQLNAVILPLATTANWIAIEGEKGEQAEQRKYWGEAVTTVIEKQVLGTVNRPTPEYQKVLDMIENKTAFDVQGHPTPRFDLKVKPLLTMARAKFREAERLMSGQFKFAAQTSRAANLVKEVGGTVGDEPAEAPPLAAAPKPPNNRQQTTEEKLAAERKKYRERVAAEQARQTAGVLR